MTDHQVLGPASAGWSDYGEPPRPRTPWRTLGSPSLDQLTGVDRERWTILGIDIAVDDATAVTVYAFDRQSSGLASLDDIEQLGGSPGRSPSRPSR